MKNWDAYRQHLISHPDQLRRLCAKLGIRTRRVTHAPSFGCFDNQRLLSATFTSGFSVTFEVNDDQMTPAQRKLHYADLADKCIKKLKAKGIDPDEK